MTDHPYVRRNSWCSESGNMAKVAEVLDGPEAEGIRLAVKRGAEWLEGHGAPDWADKIVAAVEASRFRLVSSECCAVGTALGDFGVFMQWVQAGAAHHLTEDEWAEAADRAFLPPYNLVFGATPDESDLAWAAREQAWVDYAYEQRTVA